MEKSLKLWLQKLLQKVREVPLGWDFYPLHVEIHPLVLFMPFKQNFGTRATFEYDNILPQPLLSRVWRLKIPAPVCVCCPRCNRSEATTPHERPETFLNLQQTLIRDCPPAFVCSRPFGAAACLATLMEV